MVICRRFGSTKSRVLARGHLLPISIRTTVSCSRCHSLSDAVTGTGSIRCLQRGSSSRRCRGGRNITLRSGFLIRPSVVAIVARLVPQCVGLVICATLLSDITSRRTTEVITVRATASGTSRLLGSLGLRCGGSERRTVAGRLLSVMKKSIGGWCENKSGPPLSCGVLVLFLVGGVPLMF